MKSLFSEAKLGNLTLKNKVVMAPMTRSRSIDNVPGEIVAAYYEQRAEAGLIVTEGTSPSPNGLGYARIPGIFSEEQTKAWKKVTDKVHAKGSKIFVQLMHTGRIGHELNLPKGAKVLGPSAILAKGQMWTDTEGMKDHPTPKEMSKEELKQTKEEFVNASKNAIKAGFDGVELHAANGYLLEQFLHPTSNQRTDEYGGSIENRIRFIIEVTKAVSDAIGKDKTAIRLSPYGAFNDLFPFPETHDEYSLLAEKLNEIGIVYVHLVDHSSMGAPKVEPKTVENIRKAFKGTLILSGGYDVERAEKDLSSGIADLVAFGKPFLANPDLVTRFQKNIPLASFDQTTLYTPGEKGYTDYPLSS
ncbi:alkene reductase [Leptospira sp. 2 VSF19]|uniref:Alkene reductase n=1 Tax=Leptospira soteropolitanensis TaxID=2950025 RepID=A0AAW5VHH7_9LEPT|nr:alkene reductase [Leptospira soteropolitanensis]MCW7491428.1 alkene reductase [Leptospira soteropolitanensis]MCW7499012.1 alkene reductase [Leptospira soteropolitanensis]MCW7521396.1 alkene reductase [Leptospira soteropolitanensis]MCW7525116.1 alkene reductase [Leptospira soteropolitanensis]MCW7528983.1 alkene reductase [Leptospira soteropolitanensis]